MAQLLKSVDMKRGLPPNRRAIAVVFLIIGILSMLSWWKGRGNQAQVASTTAESSSGGLFEPLKISFVVEGKSSDRDTTRQTTKLVADLQEKLSSAVGQYGIYVYRLDDDKGYGIGEEEVMPAASIMKIPIMVATYIAVEKGDLEMTEQIKTMLTAMGKRSDNGAPTTLINRVGRPQMHEAVNLLGMENTDFDANTTTAFDVAEMWRRLYQEDIISDEHREQMWLDLQDSIFEERIPAGIPDGTIVVHKVGTDMDIWADAGIVLTETPFVVVVMNKEVSLPQAKDLVPQLVKMIWDLESARTGN